jgi:hypothetical protein
MCAPNAPARRISSTVIDPGVLKQQVDTGAQRSLGELHGADVGLGEPDLVVP